MYTYLVVNLIFITVAVAAWVLFRKSAQSKQLLLAMFGLLVLTAIFDSVLIYFNLFGYAQDKIVGIFLWLAPIEDFAYPIVAAIIVPLLWEGSKKWFQK